MPTSPPASAFDIGDADDIPLGTVPRHRSSRLPAHSNRGYSQLGTDDEPPVNEVVPDGTSKGAVTAQRLGRGGYAEISTLDDNEGRAETDNFDDGRLRDSELDPLKYPPAPAGYYSREQPTRIIHRMWLLAVLLAIGLACFAIAAVIDVSSPSDTFEPGRDRQSVADGVLAAMDRSADPCDNFYEYACGSWLRSTSIPLDRSHYSKSFSVVADMIQLMVKELLEVDLQREEGGGSKAGVFYASCIDQMGIGGLNTLYLSPFRDDFNELDDAPSFVRLLARLHTHSTAALFDVDVGVDEKQPTQYALYLGQGGLGLPHRDNYFSMKDSDVETRKKYLVLIEKMLSAAGKGRLIPRQGHDLLAHQILNFETVLANTTLPPEDLRDPERSYNKILIDDVDKEFSLHEYFQKLKIDTEVVNNTIVLDNKDYFVTLTKIMKDLNRDVNQRRIVRGYLAFHLVRAAAHEGLLGEGTYHEQFKFKQHVYGIKQLPEHWKVCQELSTRHLGEAVGAAFVEKHFPESRRTVAKNLADQIGTSFAKTLEKQSWMDEKTRNIALEKVGAIRWKVGYSAILDEYEDVKVSTTSFSSNVASALGHKWQKKFARLGKPIDREEWFMNPQDVNAYYSPARNEMVFPAGILQQPFFSDAYPDAMNYGGIGAVIGHEMSHGFDDEGRKYDKNGMLTSWWSELSASKYEEKAKCYIDLYDTYKPREVDVHVRGNLTLGENLADANGVTVAYHAFKSTGNNTEDGLPPPNSLLARELTNDQLFFVAYAQTWCTLYRHEALKVQMMTDPHSPGQFRVQGPLSQSPEFAHAFSCRNSSRYNPTEKCSLWQ